MTKQPRDQDSITFTEDSSYSPIFNYKYISVVGKGAFGKVILAKSKIDNQYYAVKIMRKKTILQAGHIENILAEKDIMKVATHPFMVKLKQSFQDKDKLYLIMEYCPGGELLGLLQSMDKLTEEQAKFYAAQIVLVIQSLHKKKIIYRDLKPENILLDAKGYLKIADFGLSKALQMDEEKTKSICGTPQYFAPQMIQKKGHNESIDWWCLGCLIYEMVVGKPPFSHKNRRVLFDKILFENIQLPTTITPQLKDLITGLLKKNPEERLGINGADQIKSQTWFKNVNWNNIENKLIKAPFVPIINCQEDVSNFSQEFTNKSFESFEKSFESFEQSFNLDPTHNHFHGFDYAS